MADVFFNFAHMSLSGVFMYCKNFPEKKFVDVLLTLASNFSSCFHPISFSFMTYANNNNLD